MVQKGPIVQNPVAAGAACAPYRIAIFDAPHREWQYGLWGSLFYMLQPSKQAS